MSLDLNEISGTHSTLDTAPELCRISNIVILLGYTLAGVLDTAPELCRISNGAITGLDRPHATSRHGS